MAPDLPEYKALTEPLGVGSALAIFSFGGLSVWALKRRVGRAARHLGYRLRWSSTKDGTQRFLVKDGPS